MVKRFLSGVLFIMVALVILPSLATAHRVIDDNDRVVLSGNVHHKGRVEYDAGCAGADLPMERMIMALRLSPEKQTALATLLAEQQDQTSANYHRWLTPDEFGAQ